MRPTTLTRSGASVSNADPGLPSHDLHRTSLEVHKFIRKNKEDWEARGKTASWDMDARPVKELFQDPQVSQVFCLCVCSLAYLSVIVVQIASHKPLVGVPYAVAMLCRAFLKFQADIPGRI
jgi:hypothetical protein